MSCPKRLRVDALLFVNVFDPTISGNHYISNAYESFAVHVTLKRKSGFSSDLESLLIYALLSPDNVGGEFIITLMHSYN